MSYKYIQVYIQTINPFNTKIYVVKREHDGEYNLTWDSENKRIVDVKLDRSAISEDAPLIQLPIHIYEYIRDQIILTAKWDGITTVEENIFKGKLIAMEAHLKSLEKQIENQQTLIGKLLDIKI